MSGVNLARRLILDRALVLMAELDSLNHALCILNEGDEDEQIGHLEKRGPKPELEPNSKLGRGKRRR